MPKCDEEQCKECCFVRSNECRFVLPGTSSIENKYETIEKSLSPYKITAAAAKAKAKIPSASMENVSAIPTKRHVNVSIRKQLELQHQVSTAAAVASSSTPTSPLCSTVGQG